MKKPKIYIVKWIDSYSASRWYNDKEIDEWIEETENDPITSIGFLYCKTKKHIVLYGDISPDEKGRVIKIPRAVIKSIETVNYK